MLKHSLYTSCFAIVAIVGAEIADADTTLRTQPAPILERHCFACHSGDEPEAGLNLQTLPTKIAYSDARRRRVDLYNRVSAGEMSPKSAERPNAEVRAKLLRTPAKSLTRADVVLSGGAKDLPLYGFSVPGPATHPLRIQAKVLQTDLPVVMQVNGGVTGRIPGHFAGFFAVPLDKLTTIELTSRAIENSDTFGASPTTPQIKHTLQQGNA
jgi:hypothetical protein